MWRSPSKAAKLLVLCANKVLGQNWCECELSDQKKDDDSVDIDCKDLLYVMPSRQCTINWLKSVYNLNLRYVTEQILGAKDEGKIVLYGVDDTVKLACNHRMDVKTGHLTIVNPVTNQDKHFLQGFEKTCLTHLKTLL